MAVLPMGTYPGYRSQYHTVKENSGHNLLDGTERAGVNPVFNQSLKITKIERANNFTISKCFRWNHIQSHFPELIFTITYSNLSYVLLVFFCVCLFVHAATCYLNCEPFSK
jgi:hypothetical protein